MTTTTKVVLASRGGSGAGVLVVVATKTDSSPTR